MTRLPGTSIRSAMLPRHALMAAGLLVAALLVYWPSSIGLWAYWLQAGGATQYGLVVAALSVWLLLRSRGALAAAPIKPVPWALPVLIVLSAGSLLFWRAGIQTLQLALLPPLLLFAVLAALGTRIARIVAFPLAFLYFGLPGWGVLWPALQQLTVAVVSAAAPLVGLPTHVSGDLVTLPGVGSFEVGSQCSGVDFFVVGLAVAALIGELERAAVRRRLWLLGLMGALALVSNWIRVFFIILIGYASDMRNPLATSRHLLFGWIVFAAVLLLYLWLAPRAAQSPASPASPSEGSGAREPWVNAGALAGIAALVVLPAYVYGMDLAQGSGASTMRFQFPQGRAPWRGPLAAADPAWRPQFNGARYERQVRYDSADERSVEVLAVGYTRQTQGHELVNEENSLVGKHGLTVTGYGRVSAAGQDFRELTARNRSGRRSLIWWVYDIGGHRFATPIYSELWYGLKALSRPPYSLLYAFRTTCEPSCQAARSRLKRFIERNGASLFAAAAASRSTSVEKTA